MTDKDTNKIMAFILDTTVMVIFMAAVQGFFFTLLLVSISGGRTSSNRILAVLLTVLSIGFISVSGLMISESKVLIRLFRVLMVMVIACAPLLFLYVKTLTVKYFRVSVRSLVHFIPIILATLYLLVFCAPEYDLADALPMTSLDHMSAIKGIGILYAPPYLLSVYVLLKRHSYNTAEYYRKNKAIGRTVIYKLSVYVWVKTLLITCSVYWLVSIVSFVYRDFSGYCFPFMLLSSAMIYLLGFLGAREPNVFYPPNSPYIDQDNKLNGGKR